MKVLENHIYNIILPFGFIGRVRQINWRLQPVSIHLFLNQVRGERDVHRARLYVTLSDGIVNKGGSLMWIL
jgi:hypothetical protein